MGKQQLVNQFIKGIGASPGIVTGRAFLLDRSKVRLPQRPIPESEVEGEIERFKRSIEQSKEQLLDIKNGILDEEVRRHAFILDVHLMILEDQMLIQETIETIRERKINAEWALDIILERLSRVFDTIQDPYLRERKNDLKYVSQRIFRNLVGHTHDDINRIKGDVVVVAHDLSPGDTIQLNLKNVVGFVTDIGGAVSHAAILSKSMGIPSVVGAAGSTAQINGGDQLIVDGDAGIVIVNPTEEVSRHYLERQRQIKSIEKELLKFTSLPAETRDGYRITVGANIELPEEIASARKRGAEGVGLYRTELLYFGREDLPSEEEHFETYRKLAEAVFPHEVTIRTLDVGGDKFLDHGEAIKEMNPAMGLRAIRFCIKELDLFKTQLRGILRASVHGHLRILLPMISGIQEVREAKAILHEVMDDLRRQGVPFDENIPVGAMIEIPSACMIADLLAREVEFFSIGTNDLIQYTLAVDRVNEHVSYLYEPLHPAVLRCVREVVEAGHKAGLRVAICGEMAGEPVYLWVLLGLGLDEISMNPLSIPRVKKILRMSTVEEARALVREISQMTSGSEIEQHVVSVMTKRFPKDFREIEEAPRPAGPLQ
ncbi:MAG: phosphoenolpyruvate--protein phosphotransferase [Deltaproteobacteria bacterium]|nr:phosphoenolpyruvate--protein phosphotransferase [Deltaproteobacteria bacterium]MBW2122986.1 phosphoenolpyruvate--protein phosphotransferase [Deltaproteobacteria bacterium]